MEFPFYQLLQRFNHNPIQKNNPENTKAVVIVEGSSRWHFPSLLRLFRHFVGEGWNWYVFHTQANAEWISEAVKDWEIACYIVDSPIINAHVFNQLHKEKNFWNVFKEKHILTLEADSILCRPFDEKWLEWDMIGAPCGPGGTTYNGGVCLRNRERMLEALTRFDQFKDSEEQEDVFFSKALRNMEAKLPDQYTANLFAAESFYYQLPFGFHGINKQYISLDIMKKICNEVRF